ncbi:hypothetical protein AB6A40_011284 [Gnathostoma spinigerum]|uniref:Remodeling and spacing factor 1 n=1 Tax=Gnathostoma spinigerum TaxID=75299 RepID=A0ABD6EXA0_9BILA
MDIIKTETVEPHESQEAAISTGENSEAENIFINGIKTEEPSTAKEEICHMSSRLSDVTEESTKKVSSRLNEARVNNAVNELHNEPTFAVICSFFNKFASFLGLKPQNFLQMEYLLSSFHQTGHVDKELIELHLALLRKLNFKSARANVWEKYLLKFCASSPALGSEYLQLERYGYIHAPISTKLAILKTLCECQFDYNSKFRESVANSLKACDLRLLPLGADMDGLSYWYQQDRELSVRIYTEEPDDHSGGSWNLVAK